MESWTCTDMTPLLRISYFPKNRIRIRTRIYELENKSPFYHKTCYYIPV